jgi:hypothetical protein
MHMRWYRTIQTVLPKTLFAILALTGVATLLAGCGTRSISNSGYEADSSRGRHVSQVRELDEFQVLGINPKQGATEDEIKLALANRQPLNVRKGSNVMLVQSGAPMPDEPMRKSLERSFNVSGFTGVPVTGDTPTAYATSLRLAAARAGCESIVVYWGVLETASENKATKNVSWVPFLGWGINDENQLMRIRLKVAVIDTKSGAWNMFSPEAIDDIGSSSYMSRKSSDQRQVETLKEKAYLATADDIVKRFSR